MLRNRRRRMWELDRESGVSATCPPGVCCCQRRREMELMVPLSDAGHGTGPGRSAGPVLLFSSVILYVCEWTTWAASCVAAGGWPRQLFLFSLASLLFRATDACSTRPSPKPRPPRPYWHPDEHLPRLNCSADYAELFCLHNGTCYMQKSIHNTLTTFCECRSPYFGKRCEYEEYLEKYLPTLERHRMETAAISAAVALLVVVAFVVSLAVYVYRQRLKYPRTVADSEDGASERPFSVQRSHQSFVHGFWTPVPTPPPPDSDALAGVV